MNTVRGNGRLYQVCEKPYHRNSIHTKQTQERAIDGAALSVDGANRSIARDNITQYWVSPFTGKGRWSPTFHSGPGRMSYEIQVDSKQQKSYVSRSHKEWVSGLYLCKFIKKQCDTFGGQALKQFNYSCYWWCILIATSHFLICNTVYRFWSVIQILIQIY